MRIARFFRRAEADRDQLEQIESYIQIETDENIGRGMPPGEALAAARRKFGNRGLIREEIYRMNGLHLFDTLSRNLRQACRRLRRNPAFTLAVLLTLTIGIGANTAMFTIVNHVLLKPLPYPDSGRLVALAHSAPGAAGLGSASGDLQLSASMFATYAEKNRVFQAIGIWAGDTMTVTGVAQPEQVRAIFVSDGLLQALEVRPALGRLFSRADTRPGNSPTVLLNYGYWLRRFGGDKSVVGRTIVVNSRPRVIAGVMPPGFRVVNEEADLFAPMTIDYAKLRLPGFGYNCIARLRPGVTIAQANADIARLVPIWMRSWPAAPGVNPLVYESWRIAPAIRPLKQDVVGSVANILWVVMATIGIVMLIVCANVANLLLIRTQGRQQELASRAALGASRGQVLGELLAESILLASIGGILSLAVAGASLQLVRALDPGNLPRLNEISLDWGTVGFTVVISLLAGLVFGLFPALKYAGSQISTSLRAGGRALSESRERHRARSVLVVAQVAMALVLLVSAGLMIRTFQALHGVNPGFTNPEQIQIVRTSIPGSLVPGPERVIRMQNDIVEKFKAIPGVSSVAFASEMPMDGRPTAWDAIRSDGKELGEDIPPVRVFRHISPGLLQTMGTKLMAGRDYTWADLYGVRPVVLVSENLARELWGTPDAAIGKRIADSLPKSPWQEVIGVVQDMHDKGVQNPASKIVYWPSYGLDIFGGDISGADRQPKAIRTVTFAIRSRRAGSQSFISQISQAVWSVNPSLPLAGVQTMRDLYNGSLARVSFTLVMLGIAGAMALTLGLIGIYGVIAYAVSQRRREIGIRLALGAQPTELRRMFLTQGLWLACIGAAVGMVAAVSATHLMKSLVFGISPLDPVTYAAVPFVLIATALLASYLPARRAAAVDPVEALRAE
jgi:predicted permease